MSSTTALRLRHAADQLLTTRKTVQQIAREQGFASTRMMSDLFKRQHGVTPRQYREQHPLELARPRPPQADRWQPVAADRLYARLNEPEPRDRESPPCRSTHRRPGRSICAIVQRAPQRCAIPGWW